VAFIYYIILANHSQALAIITISAQKNAKTAINWKHWDSAYLHQGTLTNVTIRISIQTYLDP